MAGSDDTWQRLLHWSHGQTRSEWLAAHAVSFFGFTGIDPTHPRGGRDGGKDAVIDKDGKRWIMAVYFPDGKQTFSNIAAKFEHDLKGVAKNNASGIAFVTNQELLQGQRNSLTALAAPIEVELIHLERLRFFLDEPANLQLREQFLDISSSDPAATAEQVEQIFEEFRVGQVQREEQTLDVLRGIQSRLGAGHTDTQVLLRLPRSIRDDVDAAIVAIPRVGDLLLHAVESESPAGRLLDTMRNPPPWLSHASEQVWGALANVTAAYGSAQQTVEAFQSTIEQSLDTEDYWKSRLGLLHYFAVEIEGGTLDVSLAPAAHPLTVAVNALSEGNGPTAAQALEDWQPAAWIDLDLKALLQAQSSVVGDTPDEDSALRTLELRVEAAGSANLMLSLARFLMRRAYLRRSLDVEADLERAVTLALRARDDTRSWGGQSAEAVAIAADISLLRHDWGTIARITTAAPDGDASEREVSHPRVRAKAAMAAAMGGSFDRARQLAADAGSFDAAWLEATIAETDWSSSAGTGDVETVETRWRSVWQVAASDEERLVAIRGLISVGAILDQPQTQLLESHPDAHRQAEQAREAAYRSNESAQMFKARLRGASTTNSFAAHRLAEVLANEGDPNAAADVLERAADNFRDQHMRLFAATILEQAGEDERAESLAQFALTHTQSSWPGRARALRVLHRAAHLRGEWSRSAEYARTLLSIDPHDDRAAWWLAMAQSNAGAPEEAWETLTRDGAPPPTDLFDEQMFLLRLTARYGDQRQLWADVVRLAKMYASDEARVSAILQIAYLSQRSDAATANEDAPDGETLGVDEDLAELQGVTEAFFERFPESQTGFERFEVGEGDPLAVINARMAAGAAARAGVLRRMTNEQWPLGAFCPVAGRRYGEMLLDPPVPGLPLRSPVPADSEVEAAAAREAGGSTMPVILEPSVLRTLLLLEEAAIPRNIADSSSSPLPNDLRLRVLGTLPSLIMPDVAVQDLLSTREAFLMASGLSLVYDEASGGMRPQDIGAGRLEELRHRSQRLLQLARGLDVRSPTYVDDRANRKHYEAWMGPVEFARSTGRPLWSDDARLRNIARGVGVTTFGTCEVLEYALGIGSISGAEASGLRLGMLVCGAHELDPTEAELRMIADFQGWAPAGGAVFLSSPVSWASRARDCVDLLEVALSMNTNDPQSIAVWSHQAGLGIVRAWSNEEAVAEVYSALMARQLISPSAFSSSISALVAGLLAASESPARSAWFKALQEAHRHLLTSHGEGDANRVLLELVRSCDDSLRAEAMRVILGPR